MELIEEANDPRFGDLAGTVRSPRQVQQVG